MKPLVIRLHYLQPLQSQGCKMDREKMRICEIAIAKKLDFVTNTIHFSERRSQSLKDQNEKITISRNFSQLRFRNFSQSKFDLEVGSQFRN